MRKIIETKQLFGIIFFTSLIIGSGLSYKGLYLFHLILGALLLYIIRQRLHLKAMCQIIQKPLNLLLLLSLFWFLISSFWAKHLFYAIEFNLQYLIGILIILFTQFFVQNKENFKLYKNKVFFPLLILIIVISLLEIYTNFRWPISAISYNNHWFGRANIVEEILKTENIKGHLFSSPTAFFWNQNNLAFYLSLCIPFFLTNKWKGKFLFILISIIIIYTGSRIVTLSIALVLLFISFFNVQLLKNLILYLTILILPIIFIPKSIFAIKSSESISQITNSLSIQKKLSVTPKKTVINNAAIIEDTPPNYSVKINGCTLKDNSVNIRKQLIIEGLNNLKNSYFIGVGAGNAKWYNDQQKEKTKNITNVHFYWLELIINGGIIIFIICLIYYSKIIVHYLKKSNENKYNFIFLTSLFICFFSIIALSSAHYFLPFYCFIGLINAWKNINAQLT